MPLIEKLPFKSLNTLVNRGVRVLATLLTFLMLISCGKNDSQISNNNTPNINTTSSVVTLVELPKRSGSRPETTTNIPHIQIGVDPVPDVNKELFRRVYSIPGIENRPSVVGGWEGMWLTEEVTINAPEAIIGGREFAHIHDDGSLHIFLDRRRSNEAVETCWAIFHPYAVQQLDGWDGFVMLYTPQSIVELNVTFQLIVDGFNYVTGQNLVATDFY